MAVTAVAVAAAASAPMAEGASNSLLTAIGRAWTTDATSWCMAASMKLADIQALKAEVQPMSAANRAEKAKSLCKEHIDDWCQLQHPPHKDVCKQVYHKLLPLGKDGQKGGLADPSGPQTHRSHPATCLMAQQTTPSTPSTS